MDATSNKDHYIVVCAMYVPGVVVVGIMEDFSMVIDARIGTVNWSGRGRFESV